jgi:uncharacterized membrane protein YdfJ with MMPL/SSD domain
MRSGFWPPTLDGMVARRQRATIVRMVLVPAVMQLLGRANWWMWRWLDRAVPRLAPEAR